MTHTPTPDEKDGGQAFPHGDPTHGGDIGMSLRDYFAGQALAGMMQGKIAGSAQSGWQELVAWDCYSVADAMLRERQHKGSRE